MFVFGGAILRHCAPIIKTGNKDFGDLVRTKKPVGNKGYSDQFGEFDQKLWLAQRESFTYRIDITSSTETNSTF